MKEKRLQRWPGACWEGREGSWVTAEEGHYSPVVSSPYHRFERGPGRGGVPQRPPQIACCCLLLFSAAGREEGRGLPGVEWGRRGKWELRIRGTSSYGLTLGLRSLETVEIEAVLAIVIG